VWIAFDGENFHLSFRYWDKYPERRVATQMRRDGTNLYNGNDIISIFVDTFYDRRNGFGITTNSIGGRNDGQVVNGQYNSDWNPVWDMANGSFDGGWTLEVALPFKSLRYRPGTAQVWGFNALRTVRWRNELSALIPVPPLRGMNSVRQPQLAATIVGIDAPPVSNNLEIKPYAVSSVTTDARGRPISSTPAAVKRRAWIRSFISLPLLPREADVDRRGFPSPHVDLRRVAAISVLTHLDAVRSRRNVKDERLIIRWSLPPLAVDQHVGVCGLDSDRDRAKRRVAILRTRVSGGQIPECGFNCRLGPRFWRVVWSKRDHLMLYLERPIGLQQDSLRDGSVARKVQRHLIFARFEPEPLKDAVVLVHGASVVPVDEDLGCAGGDLQPKR
jgi:hypothetical protein